MTHSFSIREALKFGWHTMRAHSMLVFQVVLTIFGLQLLNGVVNAALHNTGLGVAGQIVVGVLNIFVGAGALHIALMLSRGTHAHYSDILPPWRLVWRFFASGIIAGFAVFAPIALAVGIGALIVFASGAVPFSEGAAVVWSTQMAAIVALGCLVALAGVVAGVFVALRYSMARFAVLDGARIMESLRKSAHMTRGHKGKLLAFVLVVALLNIVGAILLLVGLLVTVPVSMIALAHVYNKLKAHHAG